MLFTQAQTLTLTFRAKNVYRMHFLTYTAIYELFICGEIRYFSSAEEFL